MSDLEPSIRLSFEATAALAPAENLPFQRLRILSSSASGIHYVRDAKNNVLRRLTDEELLDLSDPKPCPSCGEQFGCEHYNLAGEAMLSDDELDADVPAYWRNFARSEGVSRKDLTRLQAIGRSEEAQAFVFTSNAERDLRALEILLLLNESH